MHRQHRERGQQFGFLFVLFCLDLVLVACACFNSVFFSSQTTLYVWVKEGFHEQVYFSFWPQGQM